MSFAIFVDATALSIGSFFILGVTPVWLAASSVQKLELKPGTYEFVQPNGAVPLASFQVNADGSLTLPVGAFMSFNEQDRVLKLVGYPITLDATALKVTMGSFQLENLTGWRPTDVTHLLRLMPQSYRVVQPNGVVEAAVFEVKADGSVSLPVGEFMSFDAQAVVVKLLGYPITLDATALKVTMGSFQLENLTGWRPTDVTHLLRLMPQSYRVVQPNGVVEAAVFEVKADGSVVMPAGGFTDFDAEAVVLKLLGYLITLDATALKDTMRSFQLENLTGWRPADVTHLLRLMPQSYRVVQPNGVVAAAIFEVKADGSVSLPAGEFMSFDSQAAVVKLEGYPVTLDATALKTTMGSFQLENLTGWRPTDVSHLLRLMPQSYRMVQPNGVVAAAVFEVKADGSVVMPAGGFMDFDAQAVVLKLLGYPITLDATAFKDTMTSVRLLNLTTWKGNDATHELRLMPQRYQIEQPNGVVEASMFEVKADGSVSLPAGGFMSFDKQGRVLKLVGYLINVDANEVTTQSIGLVNLKNLPSGSKQAALQLLPSSYQLALSNGAVAEAVFEVLLGGTLRFAPPPDGTAGFMSSPVKGTIKFTGYPIIFDATAITTDHLGIVNLTEPLPSGQPHPLRLLPGAYQVAQATGVVPEAAFDVRVGGAVIARFADYVNIEPGAIHFLGLSILVDASAWAGTPLRLVEFGISLDTSRAEPQRVSQFPSVSLTLRLESSPPQRVEFFLQAGPVIQLDEPYPFVELRQRNGVPELALTKNLVRSRRQCLAADIRSRAFTNGRR